MDVLVVQPCTDTMLNSKDDREPLSSNANERELTNKVDQININNENDDSHYINNTEPNYANHTEPDYTNRTEPHPINGDAEPLSINDDERDTDMGDQNGTRIQETTSRKAPLTVEIPIFCMFLAMTMSGTVISNMLIDRTCRCSFGYNETICSELQLPGEKDPEMQDLENKAQSVTTSVSMVKAVLEGILPAALALFLGVWSNKHGRKPLVVWPLFGYSLTAILVTAYSLLGDLSPWWFVVTSLPYALSGGGCSLFTGAYCYLNDVTPPEKRSLRLSLLGLAIFVGVIAGNFVSPYAVSGLGTPGLLLFAACLAVGSYVYANLFLKESVIGAVPGTLRSIFDISLAQDMIKTCIKRRPNFERAVIILLIVSSTMNVFVEYGIGNIAYLYARQKLAWNLQEFSTFSTVTTLAIGLPLVMITRWLVKDDVIYNMLTYGVSVVEMVFKSIATAATSWLMYLSNSTILMRGFCGALIRAVLSNRLDSDDATKMFALMSALEAVSQVFSTVAYNTIYKYTLSVMPEAAYVMTMVIYMVCLGMMIVARYFMQKYPVHVYSAVES